MRKTLSALSGGLALALLLSGCTVGHRITRAPTTISQGDQAAYYALPRTVVTVTFPVSRAETLAGTGKAGGRSCFAALGDDAAFLSSNQTKLWQAVGLAEQPTLSKSFRVTGKPVLATQAEPDPEQVFRVDLDSSPFIQRKLNLVYGPTGILESGTSFVQDRRVDLSLALIQSLASLGVLEVTGSRSSQGSITVACADLPDTCQRAACEVYEARRQLRQLPTRVQVGGLDGEQAEWLEERLEGDIEERLALFVRKKTETTEIACAVRPATHTPTSFPHSQSFVVLNHYDDQGFERGTGAQCLIPHDFQKQGTPTQPTAYGLLLVADRDQYADVLARAGLHSAHSSTAEQGFYYRVPAVATARLIRGGDLAAESEVIVAQMGLVAALPRQSTYQTNYTVKLDPKTGALLTLDADSEAIDPSLITKTGDALADAREARAKEDAAEDAAQDELAILKRQKEILEARRDIQNLLEELGEDEPPL